jgi:hypothetical protein
VTSSSFATSHPDEALDYVKRVYDANFGVVRTSEPFRMDHRRTDHGPWTSDAMRVSAGGLHAEPYGVVSVGRLRSGRARLTTGRDTLSLQKGDVFIMSDAAEAFTATCADADATYLRLPVDALTRVAHEAAAPPAGAGFAFLSRRPVTARAGRRLTSVVGFAQRHLADSDTPPVRALRTAIGDVLAATVLTTFPNTLVAESSDVPPRHDVPTTVALALDFVARNADLPITSGDMAAHASVRGGRSRWRSANTSAPLPRPTSGGTGWPASTRSWPSQSRVTGPRSPRWRPGGGSPSRRA